jgi:hypothetical protein
MKISYIFLTFTIYVCRIRSCEWTLKIKLTVLEIALVRSWAAPCLIFVVWRGFVEPVSLLLQRLLRKHNVFFNKYQLYSQSMELFGKRKEGCTFGPVWNRLRIARSKETKKKSTCPFTPDPYQACDAVFFPCTKEPHGQRLFHFRYPCCKSFYSRN